MEQGRRSKKLTALAVGILAFAYYAILSAKEWTWVFASGDSGDWLASSTIWMTPQPFGSPLYVLLGQFLNLFPGDLVIKMTMVLSVLPAAITVAVVYLIIRARGHGQKLALLGSGVLLACGIFLSQATVLEEYALASMFVTLAFYFNMQGKSKLTALCLGLGTAIHIIVAALALLWLAVNWREWKQEIKAMSGIFVLAGIVPYSFILATMAMDTPRLIAGGLSLGSINAYLGTTGTIGKISLMETPERLGQAATVLLLSFGVSLVPLVKGFTRPLSKINKTIMVTLGFCLWLYITNTDQTTWTFLCFGLPLGAIAVASGPSRLPKWTFKATLACVFVLIVVNGIVLNADRLTKQNPEAVGYYQSVETLPDDSTVVLPKGGPYGLGIMYVMANGKELTPIFLQHEEGWDNQGYKDYLAWAESKKGIVGENWFEQIDHCLANGVDTFVEYNIQAPEWQEKIDRMYVLEEYNAHFERIVSYK